MIFFQRVFRIFAIWTSRVIVFVRRFSSFSHHTYWRISPFDFGTHLFHARYMSILSSFAGILIGVLFLYTFICSILIWKSHIKTSLRIFHHFLLWRAFARRRSSLSSNGFTIKSSAQSPYMSSLSSRSPLDNDIVFIWECLFESLFSIPCSFCCMHMHTEKCYDIFSNTRMIFDDKEFHTLYDIFLWHKSIFTEKKVRKL